jgi:hypothetical protein
MKLQIIKEWGTTSPEFFYNLYIDGEFKRAFMNLEDAEKDIENRIKIKANPIKPELIKEVEI